MAINLSKLMHASWAKIQNNCAEVPKGMFLKLKVVEMSVRLDKIKSWTT